MDAQPPAPQPALARAAAIQRQAPRRALARAAAIQRQVDRGNAARARIAMRPIRPVTFEAEARAHLRALTALARPMPRAGGALMRDASLVLDRKTGRNVSADNVNRNFRRAQAQLDALRARYTPNADLIWNADGSRLVQNTRENRMHTVAARRAAGIARTARNRLNQNVQGIRNMYEQAENEALPEPQPEEEPEIEPEPMEADLALEGHAGVLKYKAPRGVLENEFINFYERFAMHSLLDADLPHLLDNLPAIKIRIQFRMHTSFEDPDAHERQYMTMAMESQYIVITRALNREDTDILIRQCILTVRDAFEAIGEAEYEMSLEDIMHLHVEFVSYNPLRGGSSFLPLPSNIQKRNACFNFKNDDKECFRWSILAGVVLQDYPDLECKEIQSYQRARKLVEADRFDWSNCEFPMQAEASKYALFESGNPEISLNVLGLSKGEDRESFEPFPLYVSRNSGSKYPITLAFYFDEALGAGHYVLVRSMSRLVARRTRNGKCTWASSHYCHACLQPFPNAEELAAHKGRGECSSRENLTRDDFPAADKAFVKYEDKGKAIFHPVVIYLDFECATTKIEDDEHAESATQKVQKHVDSGFHMIAVCEGKVVKERLFSGEGAANMMHETLEEWREPLMGIVCRNLNMTMTDEEVASHAECTECYLCNEAFTRENYKVRDHDHAKGLYLGPACNACNLKRKIAKKIPVYCHNMEGYDSHLIIKSMERGNGAGIWKNFEKCLAFTEGCFEFKDTMSFLQCALEKAAASLPNDKKLITHACCKKAFFTEDGKRNSAKMQMLLNKGIFPYDWFDSLDKLNATALPPIEAFHSKLIDEACSQEDYDRALYVWDLFECKTFKDYHDIYMRTDVYLLADVFESFRQIAHKAYGLDPAHYYTLPGFSWDAMLKATKIKLELLTDPDMHLFFEKGIRGGVSSVMTRHAQANNPYMQNYDPSKPTSYLQYWDANALYGWAMGQLLPTGHFKWENPEGFDWEGFDSEGSKGAMLEVDLEYPKELHDAHNCYPLAPERMSITEDMISATQLEWKGKGKQGSVPKLVPNLFNKEKYIVSVRNLQFYVAKGMVVTKVHRVMTFDQSAWLKQFVDMNTSMRQKATSEAERNVYKLMSNAIYGKCCENVRGHCDIRIINKRVHQHTGLLNTNRLHKLTGSPLLKGQRIFNENLVAVQMHKAQVLLNKPIYVGTCILELAKLHMYRFHFDHIVPTYGEMARLLFTDTDSLAYIIETDDIFEDMLKKPELFDLSKYPKDFKTLSGNLMYKAEGGDVPGLFKDEMKGAIMTEFAGNKPKSYWYSKEKDGIVMDNKTLKGIKRSVTAKVITGEDYKRCVLQGQKLSVSQRTFRSMNHEIFTLEQRKMALSRFDDKRFILEDGITTRALGHFRNQK